MIFPGCVRLITLTETKKIAQAADFSIYVAAVSSSQTHQFLLTLLPVRFPVGASRVRGPEEDGAIDA